MRATAFIQEQLDTLQSRFQAAMEDLTDAEWDTRAAPNTNLPGYICWHIAYDQDSIVQTLIRGMPEVSTQEPWASKPGFHAARTSTVLALEDADLIAQQVRRADVQAYAAAVHQTVNDWLSRLTDDDLDTQPDCLAHTANLPEYQTEWRQRIAAYMATTSIAEIVGYHCHAHLYQHLGELALLKQLLRERS